MEISRIGDVPPPNIESSTADITSGSLTSQSYCVVAASVRGKLHKTNNSPRDDAFVTRAEYPWLIVAMADGAGSREKSRYGASFCANELCSFALQNLGRLSDYTTVEEKCPIDMYQIPTIPALNENYGELLKKSLFTSFSQTWQSLREFARSNCCTPDDLNCTLLAIVLNTENGKFITAQVGDGLMVGLGNLNNALPLLEAKVPADPNATYFFTEDDWEAHFVSAAYVDDGLDEFTTFYMMTDGVANDCQYEPPVGILHKWATDIDREVRSQEDPRITEEGLRAYLENYRAPGSFDDRTLVIIYRNNIDWRHK